MATAIKIENVSKLYRLGTVGTGTLSHDINRWWHRIRGKEDPYTKIGQVNDRTAKSSAASHQSSETAAAENGQLKTADSRASGPEYVWALKDINLEVEQGEILGIIGRNGAGKSTLLKLLSRVTAPTTGSIKTRGRIASLLEVGTGFHPELTGRENIYLNGAILGMKRHEVTAQLDEIVDFSGCAKYLDTPVKRYSSGMKVRLGFAVAAHLQCEILIVDEVLAVGDVEFQQRCLGKMEVASSSGKTVLFVSHNMESVRRLCDRCLVLANGGVYGAFPTSTAVVKYLSLKNEQRSESAATPLPEISDGVELRSCRVVGRKPGSAYSCVTGSKLQLEFEFQVLRRINGASIQLQILTDAGVSLHRDTSHFHLLKELQLEPGVLRVRCDFLHVPLAAGSYQLCVAVVRPAQSYFLKVDRCLELSVGPCDVFSNGRPPHQPSSYVAMSGVWSFG